MALIREKLKLKKRLKGVVGTVVEELTLPFFSFLQSPLVALMGKIELHGHELVMRDHKINNVATS